MLSLDFIRQHPDVVREGLRRRCDSQSIDEILHLAELRRGLATRCDGLYIELGYRRERVRPPGELTAYSNYEYALAGYIVEQVSGIPFDQYVEQHLFQPLGMRSSTFRQPVEARLSADLSQGYTYTNGVYRPDPFEAIQVAPAGAMSATATDIANFMIAQLQNGRFGSQRILQAATAQAMQTQQFTNDPRVPGVTYGFDGDLYLNRQRLLFKGGDVNGFHSMFALLPEQQVGMFVSYNGESWFVRNTFLQAFLDHYFPAPKQTNPPPPAGFA